MVNAIVPDGQLGAREVEAILATAGVDCSELTITEDPGVWVDVETGVASTSVKVEGPDSARRAASGALWDSELSCAPYPDHDMWSRRGGER